MESILFFLTGLFILYIIGKILLIPVKLIGKLLLNGILGGVIIFLINILGNPYGLYINLTPLNGILTGIFGVPAVIILALI